MSRNKVSRQRRFGLPLVIVGMTVAAIFVLLATRPRLAPVETPERVWPVEAVTVERQTVQPDLELFGEIVARRHSELRPQVSGVIVKVGPAFHEGGVVEKGDLLVQIDPFDFETALAEQRAQLVEARARLEKLRRDYERAKQLFDENNVSEQFVDDAELAVIQQEANVELREIGLRRAERDLADARLIAPFTGVVKNVNANVGKQVSDFGDSSIAELIDTSQIDVRFSLSNQQYGRLLESGEPVVGRPLTVVWEVGDEAIRYPARIDRIGAEIASTTGGVDVFAVIGTGDEQTLLRPGAFVKVQVPDRSYKNAIVVPDSALHGEDRVYVVEDERLAERKVRIEGFSGNDVILKSAGESEIADGAQVVITPLREVGPGAKVAVR